MASGPWADAGAKLKHYTTARIELTFGELGNDEAEEIRLDGAVDRRF